MKLRQPTSEIMMIKLKLVMRKALCLTPVLAVAAAMPATEAVAGDKARAQQAVDQLVAQMQADGTVQGCEGFERDTSSSPGEIASLDELKRLIMTGLYGANLHVLKGSQPAKFKQCLQKERVRYITLMTKPEVMIDIISIYSPGRSCVGNGAIQKYTYGDGSTYTTQPCTYLQDPKKDKLVKSGYRGSAVAYLTLSERNPATGNIGNANDSKCKIWRKIYLEVRAQFKKEFERDSKGSMINLPDARCLRFYPQDWDDFIATYTRYASFEIDDRRPYKRWIR